jgi:hypothetical protein
MNIILLPLKSGRRKRNCKQRNKDVCFHAVGFFIKVLKKRFVIKDDKNPAEKETAGQM